MAGYTEEEYEQSQDTTPMNPPKGSADWAAQNSGDNAPGLKPTPDPAPGTLEAHEQQQTASSTTGGASSATTPPSAESPTTSTDTEHHTPALSPEQQQRVDATAGTDRQIKTIQDWMDAEENRPETPEERKKRDQYLQFLLKLGDLENERAKTLRELEAQQERQKLAREKAQREAEAHGWAAVLQPDKQREQAGKANRAEQEAITAQAEAEAAPELQQAKIATERARKGSLDASAANSRASAAAHGRSNVSEFSAWDENGREHKFRTKEAAEAYAKQHGTWQEENVSETTNTETRRTPNSQPQSRTSTKTKKSGHPARPAPEDNTPPSRRNNNDNTPPSRR